MLIYVAHIRCWVRILPSLSDCGVVPCGVPAATEEEEEEEEELRRAG